MAAEALKPESKRQRYEVLRGQLETERASFISHWRKLNDNIAPRKARFVSTDINKGDRRNSNIIDATATLALRTLKSGMMSGVTSPARPWFRLTTPDPSLSEFASVKEWLHIVSDRMSTVFLKSNLYNVLPIVYGDMGTFAIGAMLIEEDMDSVVRFYPLPIGSYMVSNNARLKVDTFMREFRMTVRQLVKKFGAKKPNGKIDFSNFSPHVKEAYENGKLEMWIDVCHVIAPNDDYNPQKLGPQSKRYTSCYYEKGSIQGTHQNYMKDQGDLFLREAGYDFFPVLTPRWETTGEDTYGTDCPGMAALGDILQLQLGEKRIAQAIEKSINPPMVGPSSLRNQKTSILPGDITFSDEREGQKGFRPAHEVQARIDQMEMKQQQVRERVRRAFFEDLFLMLSQSDRREITAREIDERHEEKLLALGPVLEQLNQDLLDPLIDITFDIMVRQDLIPPPPEELQGKPLRVEYISMMAQAQKLIGIAGVERFVRFTGEIAQFAPDAIHKLNIDQTLDVYADLTSVPPGVVRSDEEVAQIRDQMAKAAQAQHAVEVANQASQTAKNLSQANTSGENALTQLMNQANAGNPLQGPGLSA